MGVYGRLAVLAGDLQLVVKEYGVFSECRRRRVVDIREQAAFQGLSCNRMEPGRARFFNDNCAEKPMHVGAKLAAAGVRHVGKQEDPLFCCIPGILDETACGSVRVTANAGAIRG